MSHQSQLPKTCAQEIIFGRVLGQGSVTGSHLLLTQLLVSTSACLVSSLWFVLGVCAEFFHFKILSTDKPQLKFYWSSNLPWSYKPQWRYRGVMICRYPNLQKKLTRKFTCPFSHMWVPVMTDFLLHMHLVPLSSSQNLPTPPTSP